MLSSSALAVWSCSPPVLHPSIVAYVSMSLFCSPDTQLLQGLGLSNSSLVPRVCLGTQQRELRVNRGENVCAGGAH